MTNNDESRLAAEIKDVVDDNGKDILKDPARVNALLADLAPDKSKERELVCRVLQEGAGTMLLAGLGKPEPEQQAAVKRCIRKIKNNTYISEEAIYMAVMTIADAIDIDCRPVVPEKRDTFEELTGPIDKAAGLRGSSGEEGLWEEALRAVVKAGYCSTSFLQRKLSIGYNSAAGIVDRMEQAGVVSPMDGAKPRKVLITEEQLPVYLNHDTGKTSVISGKYPEESMILGEYQHHEIEWLVLGRKDEQALLLSKYALDFQPYNPVDKQISWESCSLRRWLNNVFFGAAFSKAEQDAIMEASLTTMDCIFLLDDPKDFFDVPDERYLYRYCYMTEYARRKLSDLDREYCDRVIKEHGGRVWWWLRKCGCFVDCNGSVVEDRGGLRDLCGFPFGNNSYFGAVRPAMWCNRIKAKKLSLESKTARLNRALKSNRE